jgi:hypothetical protein
MGFELLGQLIMDPDVTRKVRMLLVESEMLGATYFGKWSA